MTSRLLRLLATAGLAAMSAATMAACSAAEPADRSAAGSGDAIAVVTSTNVWASVVQAVGGDQVDVRAIVDDPAGDPHSYQVSARDAAQLRGAALVVHNGGGYDDFVDQALGGEGGPQRIKAVDHLPAAPNRIAGGHDTGENEHVWYDLPTVGAVAGEIATRLGEIRPDAKAAFVANADSFGTRLDGLRARLDELAAAHDGTAVAATEPVAHYLLEAAKLTDATPHDFVDAIEEETDPPAAAVAQIQRLVSERQVELLVHNPQTETPVVADLIGTARDAGLPVVEMTETLPSGQDYLTWMGDQIEALSAALGQR